MEDFQEFEFLVFFVGVEVLQVIIGSCKVLYLKYFVGEGKVVEIVEVVKVMGVLVVFFDYVLSLV